MRNKRWKRPNAHKHGVFAATAILPGENQREFEKLHSALIEEWTPTGDNPAVSSALKIAIKLIFNVLLGSTAKPLSIGDAPAPNRNDIHQNVSTCRDELHSAAGPPALGRYEFDVMP